MSPTTCTRCGSEDASPRYDRHGIYSGRACDHAWVLAPVWAPDVDTINACSTCGSLAVQTTQWYYPNRPTRDAGSEPPNDDAWCERCSDHVCLFAVQRVDGSNLWRTFCGGRDTADPHLPLRDKIRQLRQMKRPPRDDLRQLGPRQG